MCSCKNRKEGRYSRFFARIYNPVMKLIERKLLGPKRRTLLTPLSGKVLEIGAGTGVNFQYYSESVELLACEPSAAMMAYAQEVKTALPDRNISLIHAGVGEEALDQQIAHQSFDAVVCTLVLCTIPDLHAAVRQIESWLKPGASLVVLEHIQAKTRFGRALQYFFNPLWKRLAEGCHLTRPTDELLKSSGLELVEEIYFSKGLPFYQAEFRKSASQ